uniref:Uncharacterized protein n=1 Tax=Arundo donax TaxID=35708 RepID=A0A0A9B0K3_ARUDO
MIFTTLTAITTIITVSKLPILIAICNLTIFIGVTITIDITSIIIIVLDVITHEFITVIGCRNKLNCALGMRTVVVVVIITGLSKFVIFITGLSKLILLVVLVKISIQ